MSDRLVRHVRLAAHNEADVRHVLPRLEDAMRCASLPDEGARVRVVRKLALGRIPCDLSSQALSRVIEHRLSQMRLQWVDGGSSAAEHAACVQFASGLDARLKLSLRLARGETCSAWYWPLAVPEFSRGRAVADNLRHIAAALAELPEARAALSAWSVGLVEAGAARLLVDAFSEPLAQSLMQRAGIDMPQTVASRSLAVRSSAGDSSAFHSGPGATPHETVRSIAVGVAGLTPEQGPHWLRTLLIASGAAAYKALANVASAKTQTMQASIRANISPADTESHGASPSLPAPADDVQAAVADGDAVSASTTLTAEKAIPAQAQEGADIVAARSEAVLDVAHRTAPQSAFLADDELTAAMPSDCAGLLFLLPVLSRLGLVEWASAAGDEHAKDNAGDFARRVLALALHRLRVEPDEPAWALAGDLSDYAFSGDILAPSCWADALLEAPAARPNAVLADMLPAATGTDEQALVWLAAARRWLRRAGGIGLASLVLRRGRVGITPTHLDVHFGINDVDIRVRRLGLDIDPGWLPWFGKVVTYHYQGKTP